MRVLLAGATGTAGAEVLTTLLRDGHEVLALTRTLPNATEPQPAARKLQWLSWAQLRSWANEQESPKIHEIPSIDAIISCLASRSGGIKDSETVEFDANKVLLDVAISAPIPQFVLLSAICVQRPRLAFQQQKRRFEDALSASDLHWTIVRPTAFFKSLSGQIDRIKAGKSFLVFGNGQLTACKPISQRDLARYLVDCLSDPQRRRKVLPIGGPGPAITPLDQVEMLERAFQRNIKVRAISPRLFDVAHWLFACFARYSQWCRDRAEFCRIGKFYATESMLVWNTNTAQYDAALTPESGADTLVDFYQAIASGRASVPIKGEHSLF